MPNCYSYEVVELDDASEPVIIQPRFNSTLAMPDILIPPMPIK